MELSFGKELCILRDLDALCSPNNEPADHVKGLFLNPGLLWVISQDIICYGKLSRVVCCVVFGKVCETRV